MTNDQVNQRFHHSILINDFATTTSRERFSQEKKKKIKISFVAFALINGEIVGCMLIKAQRK